MRFGLLREGHEVLEVLPPDRVDLARARQALEGVLPDDLEHREPRLAVGLPLPHQALVDERCKSLEDAAVTAADGLGRLESAAPGEDAEPGEELLRIRLEQVVA